MRETKSDRIVSFVFDVQIFGAIFTMVIGSSGIVIPPEPRIIASAIMMIGLPISLIIYHGFLSGKTGFCTIGEKMGGAVIEDGVKQWKSPFRRSRWFLFFCLIFIFLMPSNMFDSIVEMENPPLRLLAPRILLISTFIYCDFKIAAGKFGWAIGILVMQGFQIFSTLFGERQPHSVVKLVLYNNSISIVILLAAIFIYSSLRVNDTPSESEKHCIFNPANLDE